MIPDVDLIQDLVEHALITRGLPQAAKLYILYRASHDKLREGRKLMMDVQDLVSSYLGQEDCGSMRTPIPATPMRVCSTTSPAR